MGSKNVLRNHPRPVKDLAPAYRTVSLRRVCAELGVFICDPWMARLEQLASLDDVVGFVNGMGVASLWADVRDLAYRLAYYAMDERLTDGAEPRYWLGNLYMRRPIQPTEVERFKALLTTIADQKDLWELCKNT